MTAEQIAYWDGAFSRLVKTAACKLELNENYREDTYADSKGAKKRLDAEYAAYKAMLGELGYAK